MGSLHRRHRQTPAKLDAHMRAHAHVEDNIKRLKESGLNRFPFTDLDANRAWMRTVCNTDSLGEQIQRAFPDARVVKSLNTVNALVMVDPT